MADISYLTDYTIDDVPNIMDVRTDKLSPVQSSKYRHTFRLDEAGFLDKNTLLLFKAVKNSTAAAGKHRFNCWSGCLGAIQRVILRVGDFTIQDLDQAGLWASLNHLYTSSPDVQNKYHSHYLHNQLFYEILKGTDVQTGNPFASNAPGVGAGSIVPDGEKSGLQWGDATTGANADVNAMEITANADTNHLNAVPLGLLLPALKDISLPLFLFQNYRVNLIVEFNSKSSEYCNNMDNAGYSGTRVNAAAVDNALDFTEVELLQDILIYPSSVQNKYQEQTQQEGGYNLDFINVNTIVKQSPAATANTQQAIEHRLNVTGEEVHYIQALKKFSNFGLDGADKVLLRQCSQSISKESVQFVVNGVETYPNPYSNALAQYNQLSYVLQRDVQVPKPLAIYDCNTQYSLLSPPQTGIGGKFKVFGYDMRNGMPGVRGAGTPIGQYPVILKYTRKPHDQIDDAALDIDGAGAPASPVVIGENETRTLDWTYYVGTTRIANIKAMPDGSQSVVVVN